MRSVEAVWVTIFYSTQSKLRLVLEKDFMNRLYVDSVDDSMAPARGLMGGGEVVSVPVSDQKL